MTAPCGRRLGLGYTLIELMIVVSILGMLSAIAVPKFGDLIRKSGEGASKGNLAALRSSITIYYGDNNGNYPTDDLASLTVDGKYLREIPKVHLPRYHADSTLVNNLATLGCAGIRTSDVGGWRYWNLGQVECPGEENEEAPHHRGDLWIGCSHTDTKGWVWTSY